MFWMPEFLDRNSLIQQVILLYIITLYTYSVKLNHVSLSSGPCTYASEQYVGLTPSKVK